MYLVLHKKEKVKNKDNNFTIMHERTLQLQMNEEPSSTTTQLCVKVFFSFTNVRWSGKNVQSQMKVCNIHP